ncbi:hypothetical protein AAG584_06220 [Vreelandella titanicae]|uniref:hypothetical protein n=1 Tax=Vreelandella titanicae TaxID=664683 RepID=UPI00315AB86E|tara:strand:- start:10347 stop:11531 length:1185 start_codon:yes stop_codon:yes gene_type:complete
MPEANTPILVHIGSIREESLRILQTAELPSFIATPENASGKIEALKNNVPQLFVAKHAITTQGGDAVLYEYNLPEFNSLAPVSGLKKLYPGLVEKQHRTVETHTLEAALKAHKLNAAPIAQLIIEQPESAQALLQTLEAQGQLHSLTKLWIRTSPESLYAGMPTQSELITTCEQLGFEIVDTQADDPDFVLVELKRNPLYSEYKKLQEKAAKLAQREKEQTAANEKAQAEITQLKQAHEKLTQQHAEQLKKARHEHAAENEKAQAEISQLTQSHQKLTQQYAEQNKALERAQHDAAERQKQNEQLKKHRDEHAAAKEKAQAESTQLKQERDQLIKQQEILREQLRTQQQRNQTLEAEMQATQARQSQLNIELERAEAQLDLIKDLLLKDKLLQR